MQHKQIKQLKREVETVKAKTGAESQTSPYSTAAEFAAYARKLREQELFKVEPQVFVPTSSRPATQRFPWKTYIVTTVFWVGEKQDRGKISPEHESVWDKNWQKNYGGVDKPEPSTRRDYIPTSFVPRQNPFYCALPYNDVSHGQFKPEAPLVIPWFKQAYTGPGQSVCKGRWVAIRKGNRTCYAQWEDCGPFLTDHFQYVFQNERPKPNPNRGAGLSVSPAVRDYLGLAPTDVTDWQFVEVRDVPPGPWRDHGENNHLVVARRMTEQMLREADTTAPAQSAATSSAASHQDVGGGMTEASTFGITEVKTTETPDPNAETNLRLQIGIKKQPDATVDHTKVKIQVFFYDTVDNGDIKLTDADVSYEWLTEKHDWTETNPEILSVSYLRRKTKSAKSSTVNGGERRYLGYRILLYYDDKLQTVQAEPARLLQLFPPSEKASSP